MTTFYLTGAQQTLVVGPNDTVVANTDTLNLADSLTGGGNATLELDGFGTFFVDQLANFTGFANITLYNYTNSAASLVLGSQAIAVTGSGSTSAENLTLGSGAVTFQGGSGGSTIYSASPASWNAANSINGASGPDNALSLNANNSGNATYDLTTNTLANITNLYTYGQNLTLKINSADAAGVTTFYSLNFYGDDLLVTSDATLDLSHSTARGLWVIASTNTSGTTFTVHDVGTALQIAGGPGQDTIVASGFNFTADERIAIFTTASIEKIVDSTGTYWKSVTIGTLVGQPINGSPIEVRGTGGAGDTVYLYADGATTPVGTGTVASNGNFDITTNMTFADGSYTLTATQTDPAGLTSAASASFGVAVDPSPPVISTLVGRLEVKGTGEAGDTVALYADGGTTPVGTDIVAANGSFDITTSTAFAKKGSYTLTATQTDAQGLASAASSAFPVTAVPPPMDFTGDGTSDVLLQNGGTVVDWIIGTIVDWLMQNGQYSSGNVLTFGAVGWQVVGTGDFTGNGTDGVLLQNGGTVADWIMQNGQYASGNVLSTAAAGWTVVGTGDYNGDGTSDVLLQNGGTVVDLDHQEWAIFRWQRADDRRCGVDRST
jgi:hypothetical protein